MQHDPKLPIRLACDASHYYGIGAVLSHVFRDGQDRHIDFVSGSLSKAEQNFAQIEREALSIVFGIRKFHHYQYRWKFFLRTDYRSLAMILSPCKAIPSMAAGRLNGMLGPVFGST